MKKMILHFLGTFILLVFVAQMNTNAQSENTLKLYAIAFHADYCGACKALGPKVDQLTQKLDGKPVEFVKFDFTSDDTKMKTSTLANQKGFSEILKSNKGTGFVLLVDAETKKTVGKLTRKLTVDEMLSEVEKHL